MTEQKVPATPENSSGPSVDCWCGGKGFRLGLFQGEPTYSYCACPAGNKERGVHRREAVETIWRNAGIPARFQYFTISSSPTVLNDIVWDLNLIESSYFLFGSHGVGKTGLAVGYARAVAESHVGTSIRFVDIPDLLGFLRASYGDEMANEEDIIQRYIEPGLLILDDLGAEHIKNTDWAADRLYRIIGNRHRELKATVFTSNLNLEELAQRIGDRITWRIYESCGRENIIKVEGPNLREG